MNSKFGVVIVCAAMGLGTVAQAQTVTGHITAVVTLPDGRVVLSFDSDSASCTNTESPKHWWLTAPPAQGAVGNGGVTSDGYKSLMANIFTAFTLQKTVSVNFDGTSSYCWIQQIGTQN